MADSTNREREIFAAALDLTDPIRRIAFLDQACAGEGALRERVQALLNAHEIAGRFLADATVAGDVDPGPASTRPTTEEAPGTRIGRYRILERIGEGGFGVVYLAEQEEPVRRMVALKIIKLGMDTRAVVARFEAERQALAMMDHPNIAKVLDGGATETGRPYFVMEVVRGTRLTAYCDEHRLTARQRLELFGTVCHAVQHAHQKGVIHRDLKPSNILVSQHDEKPVPVVIDFGIAKATQHRRTGNERFGGAESAATLHTRFHQFVGTPAYMSPEQVGGSGLDVDTRTDVYSLGVILYELLAGRPPFDEAALRAASYAEIERVIREQDPPAPSQRAATLTPDERTTTAERRRTDAGKLASHLRGDLDRIVMKCLQKDRTRRYETAHALAMDVARYMNDEPVLARPDALAYRAGKFVRRHRAPVTLGVVVLVLLVAGLAGTISQARRAAHQAAVADEQRRFALRQLSRAEAMNELNEFLLVDAAAMDGTFTVGELLARAEDVISRNEADSEENRIHMLITIGRYHRSLDQNDKARALFEQALAQASRMPANGLRSFAAASLAATLAEAGEFDRAEELFSAALAELAAVPDSEPIRVRCLLTGVEIARLRDDGAAAIARAEEARDIAEQTAAATSGNLRLTVDFFLAEAYRSIGRYHDALAAFERAWAGMVALGREHTENASNFLNSWALALYQLGRPVDAVALFRRALAISESGGEQRAMPLLLNLTRPMYVLGQAREALPLVERALKPARASGAQSFVIQILFSMVRLRSELGEFDLAQQALDEAEALMRASRPAGHPSLQQIDNHKCILALARGDAAEALAAINRAVALLEHAPQGDDILAVMLVRRAEVHRRLGQLTEARADAERALAIDQGWLEKGQLSNWLGHDWLTLARVLRDQGEPDRARAAFASALEHLRATLGEDHPDTRHAAAGAR